MLSDSDNKYFHYNISHKSSIQTLHEGHLFVICLPATSLIGWPA